VSLSSASGAARRFTRPMAWARGAGQEFTGRQKLEGLTRSDAAREGHGGGGAEEPKIDPVDAKAGVLGRDDQVAGAGKLAAGSGGNPLH
jgi:hypothetical protein